MRWRPTLQGEQIRLRPLSRADEGALFAAAADPLIWEQHPEHRYKADVFARFFAAALRTAGPLAVIERATDRIIGGSCYVSHPSDVSSVEIGYTFLARSYWGGGWNGELKRLMLDHAFQSVGTVWFHVAATNLRSQKALLKLGAVEFRRLTRDLLEGGPYPFALYRITAEEWRRSRLTRE